MPFALRRARVGPKHYVLDGVQVPCEGAIFSGEREARCEVQRPSAVSCAKTAEPIEMLFGIWTRLGPRKHVLGEGAHWRNLTNTTEPSVCGGDAACYQITLTTCLMLMTTA